MDSSSDAVDLLVDLRTMMVALLTSSGNREGHSARMPSSNTSHLPETLVSLPGQLLGMPTARDSLESLALGHSNAINHLILGKHLTHGHRLLQALLHPLHFILHSSSIQLNLHDVRLLLTLLNQLDLHRNYSHYSNLLPPQIHNPKKTGMKGNLCVIWFGPLSLPERLQGVTGIYQTPPPEGQFYLRHYGQMLN